MKENRMFRYPFILGVVALIAGLLLALVYNITKPIIEDNAIKRENQAIINIFGKNAKIESITNTIESTDSSKGVKKAFIVQSSGKIYYVYNLYIEDGFHDTDSSAILVLENGKINTLKFTTIGDDYAGDYATDDYMDSIRNKDNLADVDVVTDSTLTGVNVIESINAAIAHYGRVK